MNLNALRRLIGGFAVLSLVGCASTFDAPQENLPTPPSTPTVSAGNAGLEAPNTVAEAPAPAPAPDLVPTSTGNYLLGEGDAIAIQVFDEPDLTMDARIGVGGAINYSYLGDLKVAGRTTVDLERHITDLLQDGYLVNPSVNVTIVEYRPFFIGGEVRNPGSYPYQPGLTLSKAVALAGGLTDRASSRRITISKPSGDEFRAGFSQTIAPGDIISIQEGFF